MKIVGKVFFSLSVFLLGAHVLNANDFIGYYEGQVKKMWGYSNHKCHVTVERSFGSFYLVTLYGQEMSSSLYVSEERSEEIENSMEQKISKKIKGTEGSRLNEGIGYKEAVFIIDKGVFSQISMHEEYLFLFNRKSETCGQLKKISSNPKDYIDN